METQLSSALVLCKSHLMVPNDTQRTHLSSLVVLCKGHQIVQNNSQRTHLSNPVILCKVDSQGYELRGGGQVIHVHQQIPHDRHSICVDEHGLVAVVLRDVVQQTQSNLLKIHLPHQLYSLQKNNGKSDRGRSELLEASGKCWLLVGQLQACLALLKECDVNY